MLEFLSCSPWVIKISVDFLCTIWASVQNEPSFLSWEKIKVPFQQAGLQLLIPSNAASGALSPRV